MHKNRLQSLAIASAMLTTWGNIAWAQQQPGTNAPTPLPATDAASSASQTPMLQEPYIEATTERSTLPNTPLLVTGLVVLGGTYGASALAAKLSDRESDDKLYYPVVGPWMALSDRDCDAEPCNRKTMDGVLLVGSGVLQGLGAVSVVMSLFVPSTKKHSWLIGSDDLNVTPQAGYGELGAVATGRF